MSSLLSLKASIWSWSVYFTIILRILIDNLLIGQPSTLS